LTPDHSEDAPHKSRDLVAAPGESEHGNGDAVDFDVIDADANNCVYDEHHNCTAPHSKVWKWMAENAHKYGLGVYKAEAWHVDDLQKHWANY
ncbi:D-alanyl-D-alanine carboxypeptidase family protein, partial [Polaromonas sp.]|nr:D-alanyl-D-alanine carboxypeptidase family protein [Candidatus Saccharibacteria bacterium]